MEKCYLAAKAAAKALKELRRESDLRHQHDHAAPSPKAGIRGLHIDLGLPAAGHPVQKES